jgi:hypothetical protein
MSDQDTYRQAAAECLAIAKSTTEQDTRMRLVVLASKFLDLAQAQGDDQALRVLMDEFNDAQMLKPR